MKTTWRSKWEKYNLFYFVTNFYILLYEKGLRDKITKHKIATGFI